MRQGVGSHWHLKPTRATSGTPGEPFAGVDCCADASAASVSLPLDQAFGTVVRAGLVDNGRKASSAASRATAGATVGIMCLALSLPMEERRGHLWCRHESVQPLTLSTGVERGSIDPGGCPGGALCRPQAVTALTREEELGRERPPSGALVSRPRPRPVGSLTPQVGAHFMQDILASRRDENGVVLR